jgi:hypothetical protein
VFTVLQANTTPPPSSLVVSVRIFVCERVKK